MPVSEVVDGTVKGVLGGVAMGLAGPSIIIITIINNAVSTIGGMAGYSKGGDYGAVLGSLAASGVADKYHKAYPQQNLVIPEHESTSSTSYSQQRVNGGTVVETRNISQRVPSYKEPKQKNINKQIRRCYKRCHTIN